VIVGGKHSMDALWHLSYTSLLLFHKLGIR